MYDSRPAFGLPYATRTLWAMGLICFAAMGVGILLYLRPSTSPALAWLAAAWLLGTIPAVVTFRSSAGPAGVLLSAFAIGTSSQLALSNDVWFHQIDLPTSARPGILWLVIALQAAVTLPPLLTKGSSDVRRSLLRRLGPYRLLALAVLIAAPSVSALQVLARNDLGHLAAIAVATIALSALNLLTFGAFVARVHLAAEARRPMFSDLFAAAPDAISTTKLKHAPLVLAGFAFLVSALLAAFAFEAVPHVEDEVAYLAQARMLLSGHLYALPMPNDVAPSFDYYLLAIKDERWFSTMPVGWPAMLAVGVGLGPYWLLNPVLAGGNVLLMYRLVAALADRRIALAAAAALAISPWSLISAGSLMSHTFSLTLQLGGCVLLVYACRKGSMAFGLAAGALMGVLFLTRPLDGVTIGGLAGLLALAICWRRSKAWLCIAAYGLGCALFGALMFPYNAALTGDPMLLPLTTYYDTLWGPGSNRLGFGSDIGPPGTWGAVDPLPGHSLLEALANAQHNARDINRELFGWGGAGAFSLLGFGAFILWGRLRRLDWAMLAFVVIAVVPGMLYWFSGGFYIGARYWFMALAPLAFLSMRGIGVLSTRLGIVFGPAFPASLICALILLSVVSSGLYVSWFGATRIHEFRDYHHEFRDLSHDPKLRGAIVFVRTKVEGEWGSAIAFDDLTKPDSDRVLFVRDMGDAANKAVLRHFPTRPVFTAEGRDITGNHVRLLTGTLPSVPDNEPAPAKPADNER